MPQPRESLCSRGRPNSEQCMRLTNPCSRAKLWQEHKPESQLNVFNLGNNYRLNYRGLTGGFLLLRSFSVAISVSPYVCFILDLILISMFLS